MMNSIGFNCIPDEILRHLVIARMLQPASKLATVAYLKSYYDEDIDLSAIYQYMDKTYNTQMELAQQISVEHTRKILGGRLGIVFYDVTTLFFASRTYYTSPVSRNNDDASLNEIRFDGWTKDDIFYFYHLLLSAKTFRKA